MSIIHNKGFRIFLYILGYISCAAVIALAIVAAMRYSYFTDDLETSQAYAETSAVRYRVSQVLSNLQDEGKNRLEWDASGLEDADLQVFDYKTGEPEAVPAAELAKEAGYANVLSGLQTVSSIWENARNNDGWEVPEPYYDDNTLGGASRFLKIRTEDFIRLIKDNAHLYSVDELSRYYDLQNMLAAEPGATISKEAEEEYALYEELIRYNYTDYLEDGQYFALLDSGLFIYSPEFMSVRRISAQNPYYEFFLNAQGSSPLYITLPESLSSQTSLPPAGSEALTNAVFSGVLYQSPLEAFYSSLNDEQRTLVLQSRNLSTGMYLFANTAYSFGNDEISGADINDPRGIMDAGDTEAVYSGSYGNLVSLISNNADIYVSYDRKSGKLTQWYRDSTGTIHDYNYVENLDALTDPAKESFVFGLNLYKSYSDAFVFENFAYSLCKAIPSPVIWLILSAVIFLACVILLLIGVKAKLLAIDRVPFEIFLILYLILVFVISWIVPHELGRSFFRLLQKDQTATIIIVLLIILALYAMTAALFTTIARRIKCRCFTKDLLIVKLAKLCVRGIRSLGRKTARGGERLAQNYENALSGHKRLIIFGSVLFAVNAIVLLLFGQMPQFTAILFSVLLIAAEAFAGYRLLKYSAGVEKVLGVSRQIEAGDLEAKTDPEELKYNVKELGESLNHLGTGLSKAVESSIRDERTKAELITNVSHDIKTPLTSIISYVDLLKNEPIENERAKEYISVLDQKSQRLKQLIMDLIEVSKTGTGNIELERTNLDLTELLDQVLGEYEEKMAACGLEPVKSIDAENTVIYADGRRIFRIMDNMMNNVVKYAQPGTRVYIDLNNRPGETGEDPKAENARQNVVLSIKNVSREMLNISAEELTERFVRGDRSRHTEGSGLGLSIAKNLTELQGGTFGIFIDGDLFKVEISFPAVSR